jgi:hypothetical protein
MLITKVVEPRVHRGETRRSIFPFSPERALPRACASSRMAQPHPCRYMGGDATFFPIA